MLYDKLVKLKNAQGSFLVERWVHGPEASWDRHKLQPLGFNDRPLFLLSCLRKYLLLFPFSSSVLGTVATIVEGRLFPSIIAFGVIKRLE